MTPFWSSRGQPSWFTKFWWEIIVSEKLQSSPTTFGWFLLKSSWVGNPKIFWILDVEQNTVAITRRHWFSPARFPPSLAGCSWTQPAEPLGVHAAGYPNRCARPCLLTPVSLARVWQTNPPSFLVGKGVPPKRDLQRRADRHSKGQQVRNGQKPVLWHYNYCKSVRTSRPPKREVYLYNKPEMFCNNCKRHREAASLQLWNHFKQHLMPLPCSLWYLARFNP